MRKRRAKTLAELALTPRLYHIPDRPNYADIPDPVSIDERVYRWLCLMANSQDRIRVDGTLVYMLANREGVHNYEIWDAIHRLASVWCDIRYVGDLKGYFADLDEHGVVF